MKKAAAAIAIIGLAGCASTSDNRPAAGSEAGLTQVASVEVCDPKIVDQRTALSSTCINRVEKSPTAGRQLHAVGRENKSLESMCKYSTLPKCRRKY